MGRKGKSCFSIYILLFKCGLHDGSDKMTEMELGAESKLEESYDLVDIDMVEAEASRS